MHPAYSIKKTIIKINELKTPLELKKLIPMAGIKPGIFHIFRFLSLSLFRQATAAPRVVIETL
jgi:hypothetical protein